MASCRMGCFVSFTEQARKVSTTCIGPFACAMLVVTAEVRADSAPHDGDVGGVGVSIFKLPVTKTQVVKTRVIYKLQE